MNALPVSQALPKRGLYGITVVDYDTSTRRPRLLNRFSAAKRLWKNLRKLEGRRLTPPEITRVDERDGE